jgi:alpha-glucosidase
VSSSLIWWKHGVIYQIYPRSYLDSNGNGIGDLNGIIQRLDYLVWLGVDAIWLSPIFPSPMADFGYDVSDYTDVHPLFGDLETFDRLIAEGHERNLRIIMDFIPNHSSDQHPWFIESLSSQDNPKADWYYWREAKPDGSLPNNWLSVFGGPAWAWGETRKQYYLHSFLKEQPDLNWHNPEVEEAMLNVMQFWLDRGVDGLRMDVVFYPLKHPDLPDNPPAVSKTLYQDMGVFDSQEHVYDMDWPAGRQRFLSKLRGVIDEYEDRAGIGETVFMHPSNVVRYYGKNLDGLHLPINFTLMPLSWEAQPFRQAIQRYYDAVPEGAWPTFVLGSHDEHRIATRFGPKNARAAQMLLLTLWGTPIMYYGDELGLQDVPIPPERMQDPWEQRVPGLGLGRDPQRTPMQWDETPNAGFTNEDVQPWLPLADDYKAVNVAVQEEAPTSHLNFTRTLLRLRRAMPVLHQKGVFTFIDDLPDDILAFTRGMDRGRVIVIVNFGEKEHTLNLSVLATQGEVLLNTTNERSGEVQMGALDLYPHEGILLWA